jgi:uncharacterized coiled-coil protein SlyX
MCRRRWELKSAPWIFIAPGRPSLCYNRDSSSESMLTVDHKPYELEPSAQQILGAPRPRKGGGTLAAVVLLAIVGAAGAYGWLNYKSIAETVFSAVRPATARSVDDKAKVTLEDFQAFQTLAGDLIKSINENLAAQKTDLQRLSEQVSALATRLDAMQTAAPTAPAPEAAPARAPVPAARRKPSAPKAGPISVGGSPLPPNPADGHQ